MKYGIIDIGTNTTRLAVFESAAGAAPVLITQRNAITRLGEGAREAGLLSCQSMERTIAALVEFRDECERLGVGKYVVAGTSALREAVNSDEFARGVAGIGLNMEILSGEQEGRLAFRGVVLGFQEIPHTLLAIDAGGGSTEFTLGELGEWRWTESLPMGAVVAKEKYFRNDPPAENEIRSLRAEIGALVNENIASRLPKGALCVGVAGTISTLAMIDLKLPSFDPSRVNGYVITRGNVREITKSLLGIDVEGRHRIPGMEPKRADIIHAGAVIICEIMEALGLETMRVSLSDILQGLLARDLQRG
jgi:exopolyphosphatase / guanosine-5'-triphosphate,3'-diphosphate pyrophosphatase